MAPDNNALNIPNKLSSPTNSHGITSALSEIGLTENESRVYLHLLSVGNTTPRDVSSETGLVRSTAYEVLESLERKGYAVNNIGSGSKMYSATKPDVLLEHVNEYLEHFETSEKTLSELSSMLEEMNPKYSSEPGIQFFDSGSEVDVYKDILSSETRDVYCVLSSKTKSSEVELRAREFYRQLHILGASLTGLLEMGCNTVEELGQLAGSRLEVAKTPFNIDTDIFIYDQKIALVSHGESFGAIIKTPDIASAMRELLIFAMKEVELTNANHHD